ncbi:MAG: hypothetical protein M0Z50_12100 [Planctomycetia bacterium]|nr:hypothetical protein [Planctomycetia bacterium]
MNANIPDGNSSSFHMDSVNESFSLYEGLISIQPENGLHFEGQGRVYWSWLPRPNILFECTVKEIPPFHFVSGKYVIHLPGIGVDTEGFTTHQSTSEYGVLMRGTLTSGVQKLDGRIGRVRFHVANLNEYVGVWIKHSERDGGYAGRLTLKDDPWLITIDNLVDNKPKQGGLSEYAGGYFITHVGVIERIDGDYFKLSDVQELLDKIRLFFGFVEARHCPPLLCVGEAETGDIVSYDYKAITVSSFRSRSNWCAPMLRFESLITVWDGFDKLKVLFGNLLTVLISYLVTANAQADQSQRIIFAATILEMLFWKMVNKDGTLVDADKLRLSDKIRLLLILSDVTRDIPNDFTKLAAAAKEKGHIWVDGPHAIADIRNSFTHARNMESVLDYDALFVHQSVELALWYAETALLKYIGVTEDIDWRIKRNARLGEN